MYPNNTRWWPLKGVGKSTYSHGGYKCLRSLTDFRYFGTKYNGIGENRIEIDSVKKRKIINSFKSKKELIDWKPTISLLKLAQNWKTHYEIIYIKGITLVMCLGIAISHHMVFCCKNAFLQHFCQSLLELPKDM